MTVFECKVCGHVEFAIPESPCLVCGSWAKAFVENEEAVKAQEIPEHPTDSEKKHVPKTVVVKECGLIPDGTCTDVHVRVGEVEHPMTPEHYIRFIDFYLNREFISRVWLSHGTCHPAAALHLNAASGTLAALANCNKHGNWVSEVEL